jgi:hypothetical protein
MHTIEKYQKQIEKAKASVAKFELDFNAHIVPILGGLVANYLYIYPEESQILASVATREEFAKLRHLVTGIWQKEVRVYSEPVATYRATADCGIRLVVEVNELPPSCKVVEEVENVPAIKAQPATQKIVRRIVCKDSSKVTKEEAKELAL